MKTKDIVKYIDKALQKHEEYKEVCDILCKEAMKHMDWADDISCEYYPSDGLCFCVEIDFPYVLPVSIFFSLTKDGKMISKDDYKLHSI